jgi:hypothetical protein
MAGFESIFGSGRFRKLPESETASELIVVRPVLASILAFTGYTIDDVVNNPVAKNAVLGYYKVGREVLRRCEIVDLEHQWNSRTTRV